MCCFITTDLKTKKLETLQDAPKQKQNVLKLSEEYIRKIQISQHRPIGNHFIQKI